MFIRKPSPELNEQYSPNKKAPMLLWYFLKAFPRFKTTYLPR